MKDNIHDTAKGGTQPELVEHQKSLVQGIYRVGDVKMTSELIRYV
jgi:hypothetical protein